jgi:hypothetical protein
MVPGLVWKFYVKPQDRDKVLCLVCFTTPIDWKDGGAFEQAHGKAAGMAFPGFFPLPDGGYEELSSMTRAEKERFFAWACESGYWDWLKSPD